MERGFEMPRGHHSTPDEIGFSPVDYRVVTTVRHHYDYFLSFLAKASRKVTVQDMEKLVKDETWFRGDELFWRYKRWSPTYLYYENIDDGISWFLDEEIVLPVVNVSESRGVHTEDTMDWIDDHYGNEMEEFGYSRENFLK
jgi:hypothetical protein